MPLRENLRAAWAALRGGDRTESRAFFSGGLNAGGLHNYGTGMGTSLDKSSSNFFQPTRIYFRTPLEVLGIESWAARNCIDIPNDDMFIRWREHNSEDANVAQAMMDVSEYMEVEVALNRALKCGDQYGTGIMVTEEAMLMSPLT